MKKRVTSYDVAKRAGVSQATVSYVLNGNSRQSISKDTRERVVSAAKELNYFPNSAAQMLRQENTGYICVVTNKILGHPRYAETVQALRSQLETDGFSILLSNEREEPGEIYPSYLRDYFSHKVDGIVYIGADGKPVPQEVLEAVRGNNIPFLAFDCQLDEKDISSVDIDYTAGLKSAAEKLVEAGCKKLLYLCPERNTPQERTRKKAFREFCDENSIPHDLFPVNMRLITAREYGAGYGSWLPSLGKGEKPQWYSDLKRQLMALSPDTGIICAWRAMLDFAVEVYTSAAMARPLAVLTDERIWYPYGAPIYVSALPNRQAGELCAKGIIEIIHDPKKVFKRSAATLDAGLIW